MFGLIGHLTSLEHAKRAAKSLGFEEYAAQGLDFWCSAPPLLADTITVTSATGQKIEGQYVESCFVPEIIFLPHKYQSKKRLGGRNLEPPS